MEVNIYKQNGEIAGKINLPKEIFEVALNPDLIYQVVVSQMANRRQVTADTKDRSEVRGGGKKPWRQKGTGRARHGSIRSPLWRGGGVTFGPRTEKKFKKKIPKKMKRKALFMVLSEKLKNNLLVVLEGLKLEKGKTKEMDQIIENLKNKIKNFSKGNFLIILPAVDKKLILAARNLPEVQTIQAKDINCLDLLSFRNLILTKESIKIIKEVFLKNQ